MPAHDHVAVHELIHRYWFHYDEGRLEVIEGVEAGEQVVVGGIEKMSEGAAVIPQLVERTKPAVTEGR